MSFFKKFLKITFFILILLCILSKWPHSDLFKDSFFYIYLRIPFYKERIFEFLIFFDFFKEVFLALVLIIFFIYLLFIIIFRRKTFIKFINNIINECSDIAFLVSFEFDINYNIAFLCVILIFIIDLIILIIIFFWLFNIYFYL